MPLVYVSVSSNSQFWIFSRLLWICELGSTYFPPLLLLSLAEVKWVVRCQHSQVHTSHIWYRFDKNGWIGTLLGNLLHTCQLCTCLGVILERWLMFQDNANTDKSAYWESICLLHGRASLLNVMYLYICMCSTGIIIWIDLKMVKSLCLQGIISLVLDCIDHLHLYSNAAQFAEVLGRKAGDHWSSILNSLYQLLGI